MWGGWGSNSRPADYEKYGPALWARYLHGYHGAVPPMTLIALFAWLGPRTGPQQSTGVLPSCYRT
jgi:hypothetical protein